MNAPAVPHSSLHNRVLALQWVTLCWMLVESSVALFSAWKASSVSLLAFGSDSCVELISALVVLLQFHRTASISERSAARFCGLLLYLLAGIVALISLGGLYWHRQVDSSASGIAITTGALLVMPILAWVKRNTAELTGNKALRADALQSATCAYLAALTLVGLLLRSAFAIQWLDQLAALAALPILIMEARKAREGQVCRCC